ncbi:RNA 2',3'-cyclic phosphodiesterase [Pseudothauera rhizosphaerae]|uniref:RNA 2',3'-cyclic phosphodiesterase n=1 Tax=Pseudothauera rhizosphaerae TaxID=2565932 RepID=UPI001B3B1C4F|nr:RNA 2',3'-cyclic phosphodiesterase [Pseudothauera rhizosphaerae]
MNASAAPPPPTERLFLALWPDRRLRSALARARDAWHWPPGARRVRTDKLHLTLHFIGAVARDRVPALADALAVPFSPFELELTRSAPWPRGLAVLEAEAVPPPLAALHAALAGVLRRAGLPVEARPFRPHLTLARRAPGARPPEKPAALRWAVSGYVLAASDLGADGGYRVLARYPAAEAAQ